jgi:hypothetical protein
MKAYKRIVPAVIAGFMAVVGLPGVVSAQSYSEVITEADVTRQLEGTFPTNEWVIYNRTASSLAAFKEGPATPPLGSASLELSTPTGADKVFIYNYDHVGTKLSDIDMMKYSTYRIQGNLQQVAAINLEVDENGPEVDGGYTTLVFEPVYNTNQGAVVNNEWQTWDAYNSGDAIWWSSRPIPGAPNRDTFVSWDTIVAANPDATILGGYGINQGSGNPTLITAADALSLGYQDDTYVYNFEVKPQSATSKEQCKNGGYMNFQTAYKNQGDCVSAVASGGKARGNPTN